jgi:hypothetical protein
LHAITSLSFLYKLLSFMKFPFFYYKKMVARCWCLVMTDNQDHLGKRAKAFCIQGERERVPAEECCSSTSSAPENNGEFLARVRERKRENPSCNPTKTVWFLRLRIALRRRNCTSRIHHGFYGFQDY